MVKKEDPVIEHENVHTYYKNKRSAENKIPVLGALVVRQPKWVKKQIESVDFPVKNYIIFNNNGKGEITEELDKIVAEHQNNKLIDNLQVCHLPQNIGIAGGWNLIIKSFMMEPYWLIANDDVSFGKGFLKEMCEKAKDHTVGMIHGFEGDFEGIGSWNVFLLKDWVVQQIGLFDENFYPAYCEDSEYIMRIFLRERNVGGSPIKRIMSLDSSYYHGGCDSKQNVKDYYEHGMQTSQGDDDIRRKLEFSNVVNFEYMEQKWGPWWRTCWPWDGGPFDNKDLPLSHTTYDLQFVRKKNTGF